MLIREARQRAGLNQFQLAEMVGTTNSRVSTWERGAEGISLARTKRLADALRLDHAKLLRATLQHWLNTAEIEYTVRVRRGKEAHVNAGEALQRMRLKEGMALRALARALEVAPSRLVDLERGQKLVKPETAWWYADALGIDHRAAVEVCLQDAVRRAYPLTFRVTIS